ncbi:MAG: DNA glycosylase [Eubacteriales bacterium]|nr:DNA glycosylase [Eubacteriales bacterium]
MEVRWEEAGARVLLPAPLRLSDTLMCGQAFRWSVAGEGEFCGVVGQQAVRLRQETDGFFISPCTPETFEGLWRGYFDLDFDYAACESALCADEVMGGMAAACRGLHLLNQPVWECLLSFLVSANNNIGRIRGSMEALAKMSGTALEGGVYALPTPAQLGAFSEAQLRACGLGYRAPYVQETARAVADGFALGALAELPYEEAKRKLMTLKGVGEKVADCVLLFSCGHREAFPVDVWVERAMRRVYPALQGDRKAIGAFARQTYGSYAGLAQQYLFHYLRNLEKEGQHA